MNPRTCIWCASPYDLRIRHGRGTGLVQWICKDGAACTERIRAEREPVEEQPPTQLEALFVEKGLERDDDGVLWGVD